MTRVPDRPEAGRSCGAHLRAPVTVPAAATRERTGAGRSGREPEPGNRDARNRQLCGQPAHRKAATRARSAAPRNNDMGRANDVDDGAGCDQNSAGLAGSRLAGLFRQPRVQD